MPWKVNGERWHLSDKGFPPGRKIRWGRPLLSRLVELVRQVEPGVHIEWDTRDAILLKVPGVGHSWARWRTKDNEGLDCRFFGKKGQFNLSRIAPFGVAPEIVDDRDGADVLRLLFQQDEHVHPAQLRELLREHLQGFREVFGKDD
jgi:excinuclease ABC subunit A